MKIDKTTPFCKYMFWGNLTKQVFFDTEVAAMDHYTRRSDAGEQCAIFVNVQVEPSPKYKIA
jgi:hypothetical protein